MKNIIKKIPGTIKLYEYLYDKIWATTTVRGIQWKKEQELKASTILKYQGDKKIFVETGTSNGDMLKRMIPHFDRLLSVEIDAILYSKAKKYFSDKVLLFYGRSQLQIAWMLDYVQEPAIFWLDAHGPIINGPDDTPIYEELQQVLSTPYNHIVLIDDLSAWNSKIEIFAKQYGYIGKVENGIIVLQRV